ncbi:cyclic nucleotide-binding domain-containing protein [Terasakiella sp. SH-1]|uniref:cyclic nucleotide-binding domain-containing protein n=1 Tax=Terasakiella sp. SH-1 TaxID=2560057 RepID=UPI00107353CE|nr:cyclic nucleotide-binding domain-containing protein [Terasakiella sp. SH-1]
MVVDAYKTVKFDANTVLFKEGDQADFAYIIQSGSVKIYKKGPNGTQVPLALVEEGGVVGEMAIINNLPRSASVVTYEPVEAIVLNKKSFDDRLKEVDPLLYSLIKMVITRIKNTSDQTAGLFEKINCDKTKSVKKIGTPTKTKRPSFDEVNFLLADPNPQKRNSLRGGLLGIGFGKICDVSAMHDLEKELQRTHFDILVLDCSFGIREICDLTQKIRHGLCSKNPFLSILVMTNTNTNTNSAQKALLDGGCDLVLQKPISVDSILKTFRTLCQSDRQFVVTRNYAGPDRAHMNQEDKESAPSFSAPNTLAAKVLKKQAPKDLETQVYSGINELNSVKMERHLVQLAWVLDKISSEHEEEFDFNYLLDCTDNALEEIYNCALRSNLSVTCDICNEMRKLVYNLRQAQTCEPEEYRHMNFFYRELSENLPMIKRQEQITIKTSEMAH